MDVTASPEKKYTLIACLLVIPGMLWVLWSYPSLLEKTPEEHYRIFISIWPLLALLLMYYGLYLLPSLVFFYWAGRSLAYNPFFSLHRFILAFSFGMLAHVLAMFVQKYLFFPYAIWSVLVCLMLAYAGLFFLLRPLAFLLVEPKPSRRMDLLTVLLLFFAFAVGLELVLRLRASSSNMMGDVAAHFYLLLGTLSQGPMPDGIPFYSTFVLNLQPLAFHAMLANLKTLMPGFELLDLFRYYSVVIFPAVLLIFFKFFSFLAKDDRVAALLLVVLVLLSGGGLSTTIPIIVYPYYWTLAWCLAAVLFYLFLLNQFERPILYFCLGVLFGVAVLFHPYFGFRVGTILLFFTPLELLRRVLLKESLKKFFVAGFNFLIGIIIPLGIWLLPLLLKYPWEATYSFEFIVDNFANRAPKAVAYIQKLRLQSFTWLDLLSWSKSNVGIFPMLMFPLGLWAVLKRYREPVTCLLWAWILAMVATIIFGFLPNPYRYFEYLFLGLLAWAAFGLGTFLDRIRRDWRSLVMVPLVAVALFGFYLQYYPKYRQGLSWYGGTHWPAQVYRTSRIWEKNYQESWRAGTLDQSMGWFRGYLWGRQQKIWDIHLQHEDRKRLKREQRERQ